MQNNPYSAHEDIKPNAIEYLFEHYHDLHTLQSHPIARTSYITSILLDNDTHHPESIGYAVQATLDWVIEVMVARGQSNQYYQGSSEFLRLRYKKGLKHSEILDVLNKDRKPDEQIHQQTVKQRRQPALNRATELLKTESQTVSALAARRQKIVQARYDALAETEKRFLCLLTLFERPIAPYIVHELLVEPPPSLTRLQQLNLICWHDDKVAIHPQAKKYVILWRAEMIDAPEHYVRLAEQSTARHESPLYTASHWFNAGEPNKACQIVLAEQDNFGSVRLNIDELHPILDKLVNTPQLSASCRASLLILLGRVLEVKDKLHDAEKAFDEALFATTDLLLQAEAYFWLGRLSRQTKAHPPREHYRKAKKLLQTIDTPQGDSLQARILISEAWFLFEQQQEFEQATHLLQMAEPIAQTLDDPLLQAELYSAWGELSGHQNLPEAETDYLDQALTLLRETKVNDQERILNIYYNIGNSYYFTKGDYEQAYHLYQRALELATEASIQRKVALCQKGIGYYHFAQEDYERAIYWYELSYAYFQQTGNKALHCATCFDLTEAYIVDGLVEKARLYYMEGTCLAKETNNQKEANNFARLAQRFPELEAELKPEQIQAIAFAQQEGQIKNKDYQEVCGVSNGTAVSHLNELVEKGIFTKHGRGRGTYYQRANNI